MRSLPREVTQHRREMVTREMPPAIPNLMWIPSTRWPKTFWMITLDARKMVMVTEMRRKMLAQPFWGELLMNWGSFKQVSRQMAKKGSKQPLKTWAINMISTRGAENMEKLETLRLNVLDETLVCSTPCLTRSSREGNKFTKDVDYTDVHWRYQPIGAVGNRKRYWYQL